MNTLRIGLVSISDRASSGVYQDKGIPALDEWLARALTTPFELQSRLRNVIWQIINIHRGSIPNFANSAHV